MNGVEDLVCQTVGLKQVPELQQRRGIRCGLAIQVNADKSVDGLAVVDSVLNTFVRQTKALLGQ